MFKYRISGVRKKKIEREVLRKEEFRVEILLSSCSLVGLYINLHVKVTERKKMEIFKVFFGSGFVPYTRWGAML